MKLISALCVVLGVSAAHAQTTVSGEFFGNLNYQVDNDAAEHEGMGFDTERARVGVTHAFNDTWSVTLGIDGTANTRFNRAFIVGRNLLADGHTLRFGRQQNAYVRTWENNNSRWMHADLVSLFAGAINTAATGAGAGNILGANGAEYSGLNYNIAFNDMWAVEIALNNGPAADFAGTAGTPSDDVFGYGLTVMGKLNDNMFLTIGYDNVADYENAAGADRYGSAILRANLGYTSDIVDAGLEYANVEANEPSGAAALDGVSLAALHANYKYTEGRSVFAKYTMAMDDESEAIVGLENSWTLGHTWAVNSNINTGLFYTATSTGAADVSAIQWKWAASF